MSCSLLIMIKYWLVVLTSSNLATRVTTLHLKQPICFYSDIFRVRSSYLPISTVCSLHFTIIMSLSLHYFCSFPDTPLVVAIISGVGGCIGIMILVIAFAVVLMCIKKARGGYWQSKIVLTGYIYLGRVWARIPTLCTCGLWNIWYLCAYICFFLYNFCMNWIKNINTRNLLKYELHTELSDVFHSHDHSKYIVAQVRFWSEHFFRDQLARAHFEIHSKPHIVYSYKPHLPRKATQGNAATRFTCTIYCSFSPHSHSLTKVPWSHEWQVCLQEHHSSL